MKKNYKVLVGGSEGYIGSSLCEELFKQGYNFAGIDNEIYKGCDLFKKKCRYKLIKQDIRDISDKFLKKFNVYIHFPALANNPVDDDDPKRLYDITRNYTIEIAKKCKKNNIKFIFPSSCSVYGITNNKPVTERSGLNPLTLYSKNKVEIEKDLKKISDNKFKPIILRISTLFGVSRRMRFDLALNMFLGMAITENEIILNSDGKAWRPHVHINDVIKAIVMSINYDNNKLEIINVGSDKNNYTMLNVVNKIKNISSKIKITFLKKYDSRNLFSDKLVKYGKDKRNYVVSFKKINKVFKNFYCLPIQESLKKDFKQLKKISLVKKIFLNKKYYRLHKLSDLIKNKKVSKYSLRVKQAK